MRHLSCDGENAWPVVISSTAQNIYLLIKYDIDFLAWNA